MANTTSDKLNRLNQTKQGIKAFLISEGQTVTDNDTFYSYIAKLHATHKNLGAKSINANGTYEASTDNKDGFDKVIVNVPTIGNAVNANDLIRQIDLPSVVLGRSKITETDYNDANVQIMLDMLDQLVEDAE